MTTPPTGLRHPTITLAELQRFNSLTHQTVQPASIIDMGRAPGTTSPYRLIWLRMPTGESRLYRLIPDSPSSPAPVPDPNPV